MRMQKLNWSVVVEKGSDIDENTRNALYEKDIDENGHEILDNENEI